MQGSSSVLPLFEAGEQSNTVELRSEQSFAIHQAFAEEEKLVKEGRERRK